MKLFKVFKEWRIIFLLLLIFLSVLAINPQFDVKGVAIKSIDDNSTAYNAGMVSPNQKLMPTQKEKIISINGEQIVDLASYSNTISKISEGDVVKIKTDKTEYVMLKSNASLGITADKVATNNIRKGLELQGGTRVLIKPVEKITDNQIQDVIDVMNNRLNVYGLSDIKIRSASDFSGNDYIVAEIAGATRQEVKDLVESQGKFQAKIGDEVVFEGGEKDITFVCRNDGSCAGIRECYASQDGEYCKFEFAITLSGDAAKRHAEITKDLPINVTESGTRALAKSLDLYLDGKQVDKLLIMADLKGMEATRIAISGPGFGKTRDEAINDALKNMNKLQTVLITGSLPTSIEIIKLDSISPMLGETFTNNALLVGLIAACSVFLVTLIRYKSLKISVPMVLISLSELIIIFGFAALFRYNLDLAAIAGLIAIIGTGVDAQIILADEYTVSGLLYSNVKERIKKAFFIIFAAFAASVASLLPLFKAGAGLLTGFALVTIMGISIGVFVTRPAFIAILRHLYED